MLKFYGKEPPCRYSSVRLGGNCPHCKTASRFTASTQPDLAFLQKDNVKYFVINYSCDSCLGPVPIKWEIKGWPSGNLEVEKPIEVLPAKEPFDFDYVPEVVKDEIEEALDCLSVNSFNGFAALCRRSIQAICTDLGSGATSKVKKQIEDMIDLTGLGKDWKELSIQIMLSGHDGSHPHLPEVNADRAAILLSLLKDLTYELYTRPGKVKEAANLRNQAIQDSSKNKG